MKKLVLLLIAATFVVSATAPLDLQNKIKR
jgi:hypothetical protein